MTEKERRRELSARYRATPREAAVYRIRDGATGRTLLGSTPDLRSLLNRLEFARSTGTASALDGRLAAAIRDHGIESFELEVLDRLEPRPGATDAEVAADLAALEALWREQLANEEPGAGPTAPPRPPR